jgi:alanyl-tRNA synthetase
MHSIEIRKKFLDYFQKQGHTLVPSSSVIPHADPTLLFVNAGMNQFKDVFLGKTKRDYTRAATTQKCVRVGGKHNDLENVGHTTRHLTFFEMLGNFSFGDYFKKEAIQFAWEVSTEVFGLNPNKIWASVFYSDDEAFSFWENYLPANRICRLGEKDNFWMMGDTGPCGPCSELLYDRGEAFGPDHPEKDASGERFLEFWNLVFMQFNKMEDGTSAALPKPSVDTGCGLERITALTMNVDSVFETDILRELIAQVENVSGKLYTPSSELAPAFCVIADHLRSLSFAIADGAQPGNIERGYVLRKILRRAVRYGRQLDFQNPFLHKILPRLTALMGDTFPELKEAESKIAEILTVEEEAFFRTLKRGGGILQQVIQNATGHHKKISGEDAFKLKDTYGLPLEEIRLLAIDQGLSIDINRFEELEEEARLRSKQAHTKVKQIAEENVFEEFAKHHSTEFVGYTQMACKASVRGLVKKGVFVDSLNSGEKGIVILNKTPFYAEKGGQVGDTGIFSFEGGIFQVEDCQSPYEGVIAHIGTVIEGTLNNKEEVHAEIEQARRKRIANNHTATHLLHNALKQVLGPHVKQAGSVVESHRLRFDFSHHKAMSPEEIERVEDLVNEEIRRNRTVTVYELPYAEAQNRRDISQFFGEKYGEIVRVVDTTSTKELCGGTHTNALGTIGYFRIAKEGSISQGVRRIEAITGEDAEQFARSKDLLLSDLAQLLGSQETKLLEKAVQLIEEQKSLQQKLKELQQEKMQKTAQELAKKAEYINNIPFIAKAVDYSGKEIRSLADHLLLTAKSCVLLLASNDVQSSTLVVMVSQDLQAKGVYANELLSHICQVIGARGGGKKDAAQAGGCNPSRFEEAVEEAKRWLRGETAAR